MRAAYMLTVSPNAVSGGGAATGGGGVTTSVVVHAERATEAAPKADAPRNARRLRRSENSGISDMIPPACPYPIRICGPHAPRINTPFREL
ncbi:hypothetical protein MesoLj113c_36180 [Mesorhizobium sp. 113-3-9]|nr:hypothetical protein MesoLj113c_36180 [Mesorhizobium sp. 113-3-9]